MFFWRIDNLVRRLIARDLNEKEAFRYFFAIFVLWNLAAELPGEEWNVWDGLGAAGNMIVAIAGILCAFAANGGPAGHAFIARFVAIHWVVTLRFIVGMLALLFPVYALIEVFGTVSEETTWYEATAFLLVEILLYWRVVVHMKKVRRGRAEMEAASTHPATSNISASNPDAVTSGPAPGPETVSGTES